MILATKRSKAYMRRNLLQILSCLASRLFFLKHLHSSKNRDSFNWITSSPLLKKLHPNRPVENCHNSYLRYVFCWFSTYKTKLQSILRFTRDSKFDDSRQVAVCFTCQLHKKGTKERATRCSIVGLLNHFFTTKCYSFKTVELHKQMA